MIGLASGPVRYLSTGSAGCRLDADMVFNAMMDDLVHDGDVDLAMQKAFRWGFENEDGDQVPGLRDLTQRLRQDREELLSDVPDDEVSDLEGDWTEQTDDEDSEAVAARMETMERSLREIESLDDLQGLDPELIETVLTDEDREWVEQWMQMSGLLQEQGLVIEAGDRLELTPRAVRRIGQHILRELLRTVQPGSFGGHETGKTGRSGATSDTSSPWEYGDPFSLNMTRTMMNSILREGPASSVRLRPEDFEVHDRESTGAMATVLLIDMSRSMFYNGCWDAAKRTALALDTLMRNAYPRDDLEIIGFSERAERLQLTELPSLDWNEYSHGTNLQDGLRLARQALRSHRNKMRQIVLVTDGEPTAWLEDGEVRFEHPPTRRVIDATLREVWQCTRDGIVINLVLMDQSEGMVAFAEELTRLNRGRLIHADPSHLGRFVLRDFMDRGGHRRL